MLGSNERFGQWDSPLVGMVWVFKIPGSKILLTSCSVLAYRPLRDPQSFRKRSAVCRSLWQWSFREIKRERTSDKGRSRFQGAQELEVR